MSINRAELERAERAELIQSIKALFIPLFLFLSCVSFAAGTFLLYNQEPWGWGFLALTLAIFVSCIIALIKFQNKYRARGIVPSEKTAENESSSGKSH